MERIRKARTRLLIKMPFFGTLSLRLQPKEKADIPYLAVDGTNLYFNPETCAGLDMDVLEGLIAKATLHCALNHHNRRDGREQDQWQQACDAVTNPHLTEYAGLKLPPDLKSNRKFLDMSAEEAFKYFAKPKGDGQGQGQGSGKGQGNKDGQGQQYVQIVDGGDDPEGSEQEWKIAAQQAGKMAGQGTPSSLRDMLDKELYPQMDWRELLRRFVNDQAKNDYSLLPPNRRHISSGIYLPSLKSQEMGKIVVAVDTSGSINDEALAGFEGELNEIVSEFNCEMDILFCDSRMQHVQHVDKGSGQFKLEPRGGGGTDFRPPFRHVEKEGAKPVCLVYFTDLECYSYPEEPEYPVLWVSWGTGPVPPFGETIYTNGQGPRH